MQLPWFVGAALEISAITSKIEPIRGFIGSLAEEVIYSSF